MRPQITAYLHSGTKGWLIKYADRLGLHRSEIVRLLLEREEQVGWLQWALKVPDPARGVSKPLPTRADRLPPDWNNPPMAVRPKRRRRGAKAKA